MKGAVLVSVADGAVTAVDRVPLDVIRWVRCDVDCSDATSDEVTTHVRTALMRLHNENESGLPLIVRLVLVGFTEAAGTLRDMAATWRDNVRAIASSISAEILIEKVRIAVSEPARVERVAGNDLYDLIAEAGSDPGLATALATDLEKFMTALKADVDTEDGELRRLAGENNWPEVLQTAAIALRARLVGEA